MHTTKRKKLHVLVRPVRARLTRYETGSAIQATKEAYHVLDMDKHSFCGIFLPQRREATCLTCSSIRTQQSSAVQFGARAWLAG
jgi:hypothetical protein